MSTEPSVGLIATLAIAAFGIALVAAVLAPVLARLGRLAPWSGPLRLIPYALLLVGAGLAVASAALGSVAGGGRPGVREVATGALALLCLTPVVGVTLVRLRYGAPGGRTFYQQIAANQTSSVLLILVLFELVAVTAFLIGAAVGIGFGSALLVGLVVAGVSLVVTAGATWFAIFHGDGMVLDTTSAKEAMGTGVQETELRDVVRELSIAAGMPEPKVYVIDAKAANALSVGRSPQHAAIAVTRGLLDTLDREELQGVVAHELAHIANFDSRHAVLVAFMVGAIVLLTDLFFSLILQIAQNPWTGDDLSDTAAALALWLVVVVLGLLVAGLLKLFAPLAALAVQAAVSRDREYLADATAVAITRNVAGLVGALAKLEGTRADMAGANRGIQHLWIVNPVHEGREGGRGWFDTHPATSDRIARLRAMGGLGEPRGPSAG